MAKRARTKSGRFTKTRRRSVSHRRASGGAPIVHVPAPRVIVQGRTTKRRSSSGGGARGLLSNLGSRASTSRVPLMLGAALLGYATKEGWLGKLPLIGKAGPVTSFGLLVWGAEELGKMRLPWMVQRAGDAALMISAFNMGMTGGQTVVGDEQRYAFPGGAVVYP